MTSNYYILYQNLLHIYVISYLTAPYLNKIYIIYLVFLFGRYRSIF